MFFPVASLDPSYVYSITNRSRKRAGSNSVENTVATTWQCDKRSAATLGDDGLRIDPKQNVLSRRLSLPGSYLQLDTSDRSQSSNLVLPLPNYKWQSKAYSPTTSNLPECFRGTPLRTCCCTEGRDVRAGSSIISRLSSVLVSRTSAS
jgi:hypothetical protein